VNTNAHSQAELCGGVSNRTRTLHSAPGGIERGDDAVAGRVDLSTTEPLELPP